MQKKYIKGEIREKRVTVRLVKGSGKKKTHYAI